MTGHWPLICRGCSGHLYAVRTTDHAGGNAAGQWEVDHEVPALMCPLEGLLPLTGTAVSVHDLPGAREVLGPPV
ncbi:hypothetical protein ACWGF3_13175 [Streptomyces xanthophaeus]|uniref:Uncharacterized protein n=1 Tax=Streptomyces xanthophaeus TaxID=67385 RepID=A0A919GT36_9ACTN|nr:hypothetical protein [Streptomyces xanthophaeus]WCD84596.1 hypothetical protein KPP03845_100919 [Streptomyces xanthophaeus]WST20832.1 hypothetical protein OG264_04540 [Streptomyces xanthophaeus]WST64182.1 hypothetical protein OG605_33820 [Streptomyces xanthophaeus]GHI83565.1 hypothetical protein Sxan_09290 [Streptomyces xanthophaeus]